MSHSHHSLNSPPSSMSSPSSGLMLGGLVVVNFAVTCCVAFTLTMQMMFKPMDTTESVADDELALMHV